ncbi:MAG TPA: HAMP domain-containing sensor histidine kinase [Ramlibacter sp.]|nr:HAMP domain-containing sensor histidine kinase [Ramlibacter sp.]
MQSQLLPAAPTTATEALWVEGELVRSLMRSQRNALWIGLLLTAVLAALLWGDAAPLPLVAWAVTTTALIAWRFTIGARYQREVLPSGAEAHLDFFRRYRLVWPLTGLAWGLTTVLFFDRASLADQFICWLTLAGLAMFSVNNLSNQLAAMRGYLDALAVSALAVMAWRMVVELELQGLEYQWWLLTLVVMFWQALRQAGRRLHRTHRQNFELQFRNSQLIDSLTRQTRAALDAMEIKNRFLASAAHDIRQPVHALGLYADWLSSEPELVHELAPKIVESTKAVNQLFDSLFDLARLDSGKIRLHIEPVDVAKLLQDLELRYQPLCEARGLQFRTRACAGTVVSDPILLQRAVGNLISNAIKYTRAGGVLVAARPTARGVRIEVWDTGVGIAPEHQGEIFREFYKVPSHAGTEDGFGLGLYIVARLTHILGHPISIASRPGRGSVFRLLLLPTDARAAAGRAVSSLEAMLPSRGKPG